MEKKKKGIPHGMGDEKKIPTDQYGMRCGEIHVNVEFSDSKRSLSDCLWNVLCRFEDWK